MIVFNYLVHNNSLPIPFNLSISPLHLKEETRDAVVINCSSDTYIGDYYICYSKNLNELEKLDIDDRHCCYCSNEASDDCIQKFSNWKIEYAERQNASTCLLNLRDVTKNDSGFYQCRVYELIKYPCKRRYGTTYNCSVSATSNNDPNALSMVWCIVIGCAVTAFIIITVIVIVIVIVFVCKHCKRRYEWKNYKFWIPLSK